jgi:hypothetical protein
MPHFFNRPAPQQAVPGDLSGLRSTILQVLQGGGAAQHQNGVLGQLLGLTGAQGGTPGGDVLGPLSASFHQNLTDALSQINNQGGRFSTGNAYLSGQAAQRSLNDFNLLGSQVLEHGRDRQLSAIMGLLGPTLQPTFGGPFTQQSSGFENLLGLANAASNFIPGNGGKK